MYARLLLRPSHSLLFMTRGLKYRHVLCRGEKSLADFYCTSAPINPYLLRGRAVTATIHTEKRLTMVRRREAIARTARGESAGVSKSDGVGYI